MVSKRPRLAFPPYSSRFSTNCRTVQFYNLSIFYLSHSSHPTDLISHVTRWGPDLHILHVGNKQPTKTIKPPLPATKATIEHPI